MVSSNELYRKLKTILPENPAFEATQLIVSFAGLDRAELLRGDEISDENALRVLGGARRRMAGEPLQYILGEWTFDGRRILCKSGVLIPREDTLCLVENAERAARDAFPKGTKIRILDLCCGSGCVGLALAKRMENEYAVSVTAVDISPDCLALTQENALLWGLSDRVTAVFCDLLTNCPDGEFDLVVSNPPYVKSGDIGILEGQVRDFEPHLALDGGEDGLLFYRRIAELAERLVPRGPVAVETGYDTGEAVQALFLAAGWNDVRLFRDGGDCLRAVVANR